MLVIVSVGIWSMLSGSTIRIAVADWSGNMKIYDSVLKPCPFCGNKTSVHAYTYKDAVYRQYAVKCNKCGARIMGASTELAIDKWNRRVTPEVKRQYALEHPEVVHCNECFYGESADDKEDGYRCRHAMNAYRSAIWFGGDFCSYGERNDE